MKWKILLYESVRGDKPVEDFIRTQQLKTTAKIMHTINLLAMYGYQLGMPHTKKLDRNIYELRIRGRDEIRILYGFKHNTIYLLHGFKKQKQKIPAKEIDIARKRFFTLT